MPTADESDSTATGAASALTADDLEQSLISADEVGSGWHTENAEPFELGGPDDVGGRCPTGSSFAAPAEEVSIRFEPPELTHNTIEEGLLTFESREGLDGWMAGLESCVGERWEELDDPVEYVSLEHIDVADHGDDRAGFLFLFAHSEGDSPAHASRWFLIRVGEVLLLVTGDDYQLDSSEDEAFLDDVVARAVAKVEATLPS